MNQAPRFVGIGELLWDLLRGGRQLGGAPANFACHAKALEAEATVIICSQARAHSAHNWAGAFAIQPD